MTMTPLEAQSLAASDTCWAALRECKVDITRIAFEGPNSSQEDTLLIHAVFAGVLGELIFRELQSRNPPDDEEDPGGDRQDGQDGESGAQR